ncbi:MAG: AraC family transcriptional regulator [Telmatospirillum sp.]|nr:AraC family transcriptional regulator [Telmatospirillum sp.]
MHDPMEGWIRVDLPRIDQLNGKLVLRFQHLPRRHGFPVHQHRWNQIVYASSGTLLVTVGNNWYVISPDQAMWVPTGVPHTTGALQDAELRNLYVADSLDVGMPPRSLMLSVTPLLRALIMELADVHQRPEDADYVGRLETLTLDQLPRQPELDFHLPWPKSPMLQSMCQALYSNPADRRDLEAWSRQLGTSPRTLTRHFERELGISLREWRLRLRLFKAIDLLETEDNITAIALDLGYNTPSAFTHMFHQRTGCTPSDWRRR